MKIEKLEIKEGFLSGLVLNFTPGLNVIIGPRGAGKSSILELIRFACRVPAPGDLAQRVDSHIRGVLGTGKVVVTIEQNGKKFQIERSAQGVTDGRQASWTLPTILSQGQIEAVGVSAAARVELIDSLRQQSTRISPPLQLMKQAATFTSRIAMVNREILTLGDVADDPSAMKGELQKSLTEQANLLRSMQDSERSRKQLEGLGAARAKREVLIDGLSLYVSDLDTWLEELKENNATLPSIIEYVPSGLPRTLAEQIKKGTNQSLTKLRDATESVREVLDVIEGQIQSLSNEQKKDEDIERDLRILMDKFKGGAGALSAKIAETQKRIEMTEARTKKRAELRKAVAEFQRNREAILDDIERSTEQNFKARKQIASEVTRDLEMKIRVSVFRRGIFEQYEEMLAKLLRGSGVQYASLGPAISRRVSPRSSASSRVPSQASSPSRRRRATRGRWARSCSGCSPVSSASGPAPCSRTC